MEKEEKKTIGLLFTFKKKYINFINKKAFMVFKYNCFGRKWEYK
jgi:hypothetical protein